MQLLIALLPILNLTGAVAARADSGVLVAKVVVQALGFLRRENTDDGPGPAA